MQKRLGTIRLTDVNCRASAEENQVVENSRQETITEIDHRSKAVSESKPGKLVRLEQLSGSLNAVEEQTDLVRGDRRDASTWTLMGFHKRSSFKQ